MSSEKNSEKSQNLRLDIFQQTGLKIDEQDPIIQLYLIQDSLLNKSIVHISEKLLALTDATIADIKDQQKAVLSNFDVKANELEQILSRLDKQKEMIVADVWQKLDQRFTDKINDTLKTGMDEIAKNSNNKINNQRNMLIGGVGGLVVGILLCLVVFYIVLK